MKRNRIMIAAPSSGSGKTLITCALLWKLKHMGYQAAAYKCGPDYIDPMFHEKILGIPSKNLDTFFTGEEKTKELFMRDKTEGDFAVLEGVMGLFDGLGGVSEEGSSYHLAKVTETPVIIVVDAKGMGRSLLPLLAGFLAYDTKKLISGVIFNRMTGNFYETIKPLVEKELHLEVFGYFPEKKELCIGSRYLGLKMPHEIKNLKNQIRAAAQELEKTVSLEKIIQTAEAAGELDEKTAAPYVAADSRKPVIAVARDEVFCFYYQDNLRLLQDYGAKLVYFSPLHDICLPDGCSGLLLGGGYPELAAEKLSNNRKMRASIKKAIARKIPSVAECGGFLYLHSKLQDKTGVRYPMADVIPGICRDTGRLVRFGYVEIEEKQSFFLPEKERIRGHEFHYYDSTCNGSGCRAVKPVTGKAYDCILEGEHYWWGFPHLYYPSNPEFARRFVEMASSVNLL